MQRLAGRVPWLVLVALLVSCATGAPPQRYFFTHVDSTMGFGDKMHYYYRVLYTAHLLKRTAVLPPFQITLTDYSGIAHVDVLRDGPAALKAAVRTLTGKKLGLSFDLPSNQTFVEVSEWFDMDYLAEQSGVTAVTTAQWRAVTGGTIGHCLVPFYLHGCVPSYENECALAAAREEEANMTNRELAPRKSSWFDNPVDLQRVTCVAPDLTSMDDATEENVLEPIRDYGDVHATTLAVDGFCLRFPALHQETKNMLHQARAGWEYAQHVKDTVMQFLKDRSVARFAALHWRRGDVVVDHPTHFLSHTPENVVPSLHRELSKYGASGLDAIVLLTDNFMESELSRLQTLINRHLGLPVYRFNAHANLTLHTLSAESVIVDLAFGSLADSLVCTHFGSSFCQVMAMYRQQKSLSTTLALHLAHDEL